MILVVLPLEGFIGSHSLGNQGAMVGKEAANHQRSKGQKDKQHGLHSRQNCSSRPHCTASMMISYCVWGALHISAVNRYCISQAAYESLPSRSVVAA